MKRGVILVLLVLLFITVFVEAGGYRQGWYKFRSYLKIEERINIENGGYLTLKVWNNKPFKFGVTIKIPGSKYKEYKEFEHRNKTKRGNYYGSITFDNIKGGEYEIILKNNGDNKTHQGTFHVFSKR